MDRYIKIGVVKVEPGDLIYDPDSDGYDRTSTFELIMNVIPEFENTTEKREWFYDNWDDIKMRTTLFVEDFIKKYFDTPRDHIYVTKIYPIFKGVYDKNLSDIYYKAIVKEIEKL